MLVVHKETLMLYCAGCRKEDEIQANLQTHILAVTLTPHLGYQDWLGAMPALQQSNDNIACTKKRLSMSQLRLLQL